jgi:hypothetical protein
MLTVRIGATNAENVGKSLHFEPRPVKVPIQRFLSFLRIISHILHHITDYIICCITCDGLTYLPCFVVCHFLMLVKGRRELARSRLPFHLAAIVKDPINKEAKSWIADRLSKMRGSRALEDVAVAVGLQPGILKDLEKGNFRMSLGGVKKVLKEAYSTSLEELLKAFCDEKQDKFQFNDLHPFDREFYYTIRWEPPSETDFYDTTQFLIGGIEEKFIWAVPIRGLRSGQLAHIGLLELGPARKGAKRGNTERNSHQGEAIIYTIHGKVDVFIEVDRRISLQAGHSVHLNPKNRHHIENPDKNLTALLQVTYVGW